MGFFVFIIAIDNKHDHTYDIEIKKYSEALDKFFYLELWYIFNKYTTITDSKLNIDILNKNEV